MKNRWDTTYLISIINLLSQIVKPFSKNYVIHIFLQNWVIYLLDLIKNLDLKFNCNIYENYTQKYEKTHQTEQTLR